MVDTLLATWPSDDTMASRTATIDTQESDVMKQHAAFARDALEALATTDRFALVLDFLDNNQLETAQRLVQRVDCLDADRRCALRASYRLGA